MLDYSIIIPVHNESENIRKLILEIKNVCKGKFEIIVVNDKSTDNTLEILENINDIIIVNHKVNSGQSKSMISGALVSKSDICVFIDGDGQNNPIYINGMVKELKKSDFRIKLNIGTRLHRKSGLSKKIQSFFGNFIRNIILNDKCKDSGCGLKVIYRDIFLSLHRINNMHRFIPYLLKISNYEYIDTEIIDRPREYGVSHYNILTRFISILETFTCFLLWFITSNLRSD